MSKNHSKRGLGLTLIAAVFVLAIGWRTAPVQAQCCGSHGSSHSGHQHDEHAGHHGSDHAAHDHRDAGQASMTRCSLHGGQVTGGVFQHFEVVYLPNETRVYLYGHIQRPISAHGVQGQVTMRVRGNDQIFRYPLQYVEPAPGSNEQDYVVAVVDVTPIRDGDMTVTFELTNLPNNQEPQVAFTQIFALLRTGPQVAVASLTEGDQASVARQQVCPVAGGSLGSMGPPIKVLVGGRPLYLCCKGCIAKVQEAPEFYLNKTMVAPPPSSLAVEDNRLIITRATAGDETAISAQRVCPVMNTQLGSHGSPIKVTLDGRSLFVCCEGCISKVQENPDHYFAQATRLR